MDEILFPTQQKSNSHSDTDDGDLKFFNTGSGDRKDSETSDTANDTERDIKEDPDADGDAKNTDGDGDSEEPAHKKIKTKKELEEEERERMQ